MLQLCSCAATLLQLRISAAGKRNCTDTNAVPDDSLPAQALGALCADRPNLTLSQNLDFGLRQVVKPPPTKLPRCAGMQPGGAAGALAEVAALAAPGGLTATLAQLTSRIRDTGAQA